MNIFVQYNMEECPICMEPLSGTVVHLGCCKKQVHIQCYISRCPFCRSDLLMPPAQPLQHVIIPVPIAVEDPRRSSARGLVATLVCMGIIVSPLLIFTVQRNH